ncbi:Qat anti-phage system TatD family nuclease QatD [Brucella oryzae]|uniref:Qat anti-phage system TatD family nuclease QatD n=1 Tax=Brucella oryzae TaxID=335286 RepID=UPI0035BC2647
MIDFHCHLDLLKEPHRAARAIDEAGVYMLSVTTTPKAFLKTAALAKDYKRIKTALGLHPELAHLRQTELSLFDRLVSETRYVGEIGLDGSSDFKMHFDTQMHVFRHILNSCKKAGGRILSIHSRNAAKPVLDTLEDNPGFGIPVLHWFSGSHAQLQRAIAMDCWFSVGRPMLKSTKGKELVSQMPVNRILTETDAPFTSTEYDLYPLDHIQETVTWLSALWSMQVDDVDCQLSNNLRALVTKDIAA